MAEKPDPISAPSHYTAHPSGVEALQITAHHSFNVGNAIKYLWRMGLKDGEAELKDLSKALFYVYAEARKKGAKIPDFKKIDQMLASTSD